MSTRKDRPVARILACVLTVGLARLAPAQAQQPPAATPVADDLDTINARYLDELSALESKRLKQIDALAQKTTGEEQSRAYIALFQGALASGIYPAAEPAAERLIESGHIDPGLVYLASLVNILAEIDRGDYEESLASLASAVRAAKATGADGAAVSLVMLPRDTRLMVAETYYQKLVQADQFEVAKKACRLIAEGSPDEAIRAYASERLARLEKIGKPAPSIEGKDIDGKPFRLADLKGDVVLVVFWASWCLPSGPESEYLGEALRAYKDKGLRVVGINLDPLQETGAPAAAIEADVRRFLVEHHVAFPNLINGQGNPDFAKAYGVTDIPSSFLIDRQGHVAHIDLTLSNLESVIERTLGDKK